jgi:hypothetical protein
LEAHARRGCCTKPGTAASAASIRNRGAATTATAAEPAAATTTAAVARRTAATADATVPCSARATGAAAACARATTAPTGLGSWVTTTGQRASRSHPRVTSSAAEPPASAPDYGGERATATATASDNDPVGQAGTTLAHIRRTPATTTGTVSAGATGFAAVEAARAVTDPARRRRPAVTCAPHIHLQSLPR